MSNPFDETLKHLVELHPEAWLEFVGISGRDAEVIDADLSTLTTAADKVIKVQGDPSFLAHIEFQSGDPTGLGERSLLQDVLLHHRHALSVLTVVILFRKPADRPRVPGVIRRLNPMDGSLALEYRYQVIRLWDLPAERLLSGPGVLLPLAPLGRVNRVDLPAVIARMQDRIGQEVSSAEARELWSATYILMGLKYSEAFSAQLLKGVQEMEDSVTYQAILHRGEEKGRREGREEGRLAEARAILMRLGSLRFGLPSDSTRASIEAVDSPERLEQLTEKLLQVENWDELLAP